MGNTTPEEFDLFKSECLRWLKFFGLTDWDVVFEHKALKGNYAQIRVDGLSDRCAVFSFNLECDEESRQHMHIERTAFHEVMELFLFPLHYIGTCRYVQPEEFDAANHAIIRTMENTVWPILMKEGNNMREIGFNERYRECRADGTAFFRDNYSGGYNTGDSFTGVVWCKKYNVQCMSSVCREDRNVEVAAKAES